QLVATHVLPARREPRLGWRDAGTEVGGREDLDRTEGARRFGDAACFPILVGKRRYDSDSRHLSHRARRAHSEEERFALLASGNASAQTPSIGCATLALHCAEALLRGRASGTCGTCVS